MWTTNSCLLTLFSDPRQLWKIDDGNKLLNKAGSFFWKSNDDWKLDLIEDNKFKLRKLNSEEVLGASDDGTVSEQVFVEGQPNQVWIKIIPRNEGENFYSLKNQELDKLLTPAQCKKELIVQGN